jgi:hypothetical protein
VRTSFEEPYDFVLADGPPLAHGRAATLFALDGKLAPNWELWLDDAHRQHEQECLALWARHLPFSVVIRDVDEKGLALIGPPAPAPRRNAVPPNLGVSVLTGGRPDLLRTTVETLLAGAPRLLADSYVIALVNGRDPRTEAYVRTLSFIDRTVVLDRRVPVGPATSRLVGALASVPAVRTILHLEDDWAACTLKGDWLESAVAVLGSQPRVGQVRLRHRSDSVLAPHMVTGRPIVWTAEAGYLRSPSAHFTFNPSLVRAADVPRVFPCSGEADAQRRFLRAGLATAQLTPGVFRHIGEGRGIR